MPEKDQSTEQRILQAARKVFIQKGMSGARMQDIADEAGINKALLHYYFRNKEKLFDMVFREAAQQLFVSIRDIVQSEDPLFDKIRAITERYISVLSESPFIPVFVLHEISRDPERILQIFREKTLFLPVRQFLTQIQEEAAAGRIRPVSPPQLLMNILSLCVFPFAAKPLFQSALSLDEWQFRIFTEERKEQVAEFIIAALQPGEAEHKAPHKPQRNSKKDK